MSCETVRDQLGAYVADTLPPPERKAVASHVESCPSCRLDLAALERVRMELPTLRSDRESADVDGMWAAIRPRLATRRGWATRPRSVPPWVMAAAAAALVVASVAGTWLFMRIRVSEPAGVSARIGSLEADYESASAELARLLEQARARLPAETVASLERSLSTIDTAIVEVRQALSNDPGNPALEQLVLSAWRQKVELLRRATAIGVEL